MPSDDTFTPDELISAWCAGTLEPDQDGALRKRMTADEDLRAAYRAFLRQQLAEVWVPSGDPRLDIEPDLPWLMAPLPHLGPGHRLEAYRDERGTTWCWPGRDAIVADPRTERVDLAGDETTGPIHIDLRYGGRSLLDEARLAETAARAIGTGKVTDRERTASLARAIAGKVTSLPWIGCLRRAKIAFDTGQDPAEDDRRATLLALETRLWLDDTAGATLAPAVVEEAQKVDHELARYGNALFVIDALDYAEAVRGRLLDTSAWWGERARLDEAVPESFLDEAITRRRAAVPLPLAAASSDMGLYAVECLTRLSSATPADSIRALDEALSALHALPCPWLRPAVRRGVDAALPSLDATGAALLRAALGPRPGAVPIVVVSTTTPLSYVLELRVSSDRARGAAWSKATQIRATAQRAALDGFRQAAQRTKTRLPPRRFVEHAFELVCPPDLREFTVDGDSLALPAALAFASLWTDTPILTDLVASARPSGANVGPVGHVDRKAAAVFQTAGPAARFAVHADVADEVRGTGVGVVKLVTWEDGLRAAGLLDPLRALSPVAGPTIEVEMRLQMLVNDAKQQNLRDFEDAAGPEFGAWQALADEIRILVDWLEINDVQFARSDARVRARCHGALAYTYAGDPLSADQLLEPIEIDELPPSAAALLDVVALSSAISKDDWEPARRLRERLEGQLADRAILEVRGLVLGTLGRESLHRPDRDLPRALEFLEAALAHHQEHVPYEAPRSRCYLANALRIAGVLDQAAEQVENGLREIDTVALKSESYAASTRMFLHYERARVLLDRGRAADAAEEARRALEMGAAIGWHPPLPGILRTLAWALRSCGNDLEYDEVIQRLEQVARERERALDHRILAEARGPYRRDGEAF
jgi:tetratricopeptide (TPR) repeat protein